MSEAEARWTGAPYQIVAMVEVAAERFRVDLAHLAIGISNVCNCGCGCRMLELQNVRTMITCQAHIDPADRCQAMIAINDLVESAHTGRLSGATVREPARVQ